MIIIDEIKPPNVTREGLAAGLGVTVEETAESIRTALLGFAEIWDIGTPEEGEKDLARLTAAWNALELKIERADRVMELIDEAVRRGHMDARSAIADARLLYGDPA